MLALKNKETDKNLKILEEIDIKNDNIRELEKEVLAKTEEANLRREIVDSMSASLLQHELE